MKFFIFNRMQINFIYIFFFSSRRRHTRCGRDWSSDMCSSDLLGEADPGPRRPAQPRGRFRVGERGHLLRPVQPEEGESPPRRGAYAPDRPAATARAGALRDALGSEDPGRLAALPHRFRLTFLDTPGSDPSVSV